MLFARFLFCLAWYNTNTVIPCRFRGMRWKAEWSFASWAYMCTFPGNYCLPTSHLTLVWAVVVAFLVPDIILLTSWIWYLIIYFFFCIWSLQWKLALKFYLALESTMMFLIFSCLLVFSFGIGVLLFEWLCWYFYMTEKMIVPAGTFVCKLHFCLGEPHGLNHKISSGASD